MSTPEYKREYNRGWAASQRFGRDLTGRMRAPLDNPSRSDAYIDGYLDHATGRDKWHLETCIEHHNAPGGCGQA